jgi:hypothetical protein
MKVSILSFIKARKAEISVGVMVFLALVLKDAVNWLLS